MDSFENRLKRYKESTVSTLLGKEVYEYLFENGFFTAPASTKYHGNYAGGLFDHSYRVMEELVELTYANSLKWERRESPYLVGMLHDICKIDQYKHPMDDLSKWEFNTETDFKGHGDKSVMMLASLVKLTEEEAMCIRYHMGAFTDKEEWGYYTRAVHKYPNVLWTHHADMIASHIYNT